MFDDLQISLEEAVEIQGERQPAKRVTRYEVADVEAIRAQFKPSSSTHDPRG